MLFLAYIRTFLYLCIEIKQQHLNNKVMNTKNNSISNSQDVNAYVLEAVRLFNSTVSTNVKVRKNCEEYIKEMLLAASNNEIPMTGDKGEVMSVTYDGGAHPEYASNAFSLVQAVYLKDDIICLSTG